MQDNESDAPCGPSEPSNGGSDAASSPARLNRLLLLIVGAAVAAAGGYAGSLWLLPGDPANPGAPCAIAPDDATDTVDQTAGAGSGASTASDASGTAAQSAGLSGQQQVPGSGAGPAKSIGLVALLGNRIADLPETVAELREEVTEVADCVLREFPTNPDALEVVARFNFQLGRLEQASKIWNKVIELDPNYGYAYEGLGKIAIKKEETEKAINLFRKSLASNPDQLDTQLALARALIDMDKTKAAIELLEQNIERDPRPYRGRELLGMAYMQMMDYKKAKENYLAAVEALPVFSAAFFGLATACTRLGEKDLAKKYLAKFRDLRSKERDFVSSERSNFDDLDANRSEAAQMYTNAAVVCQSARCPADAMVLCQRATVLDTNNIGARQALAWMYLKQGKPDETIRMLEQLAKLQPANFQYPLEIARLYARMGRMSEAEQRLVELRDANPKNAVGYAALAGHFLRFNVKLDEAVGLAQKAVSLKATPANCLLLSTAFQKTGDLAGAVAAMAEVVKLAPKNLQYRQMYELLKTKQTEQSEQKQ